MAASLALNAQTKILTLSLGGDAQPATVDWTSGRPGILLLESLSGQPEMQVRCRAVSAGISTVTATLLDSSGSQIDQVTQNIQVTGSDPESATIATTASAETAAASYATSDPSAPGAGHVATTSSAPPVVAAGAGAGTAPPAPTVAGDDAHGTVEWGTGTAPAAGVQVSLTFNRPYGSIPAVTLTPANDATEPLGIEVGNVTVNGFDVVTHAAGGVSQAASTYAVEYVVVE